ncbi:hypothetical protein HDU99_006363 [Rhizoclosmatium hyalinum]|nr:hypothetical protein HDU99_006363 [Rhizoclosmatium hyalinum]
MASQLVELEDVDMSPRGSGYALDPRTSIHPNDEGHIHRRRSVSPAPLPPQSYRNDDDYHNDRRRVSPKRDYAGEDGERDIRVDHHLREDIEMHERHR